MRRLLLFYPGPPVSTRSTAPEIKEGPRQKQPCAQAKDDVEQDDRIQSTDGKAVGNAADFLKPRYSKHRRICDQLKNTIGRAFVPRGRTRRRITLPVDMGCMGCVVLLRDITL
jgi:hypothetical protein